VKKFSGKASNAFLRARANDGLPYSIKSTPCTIPFWGILPRFIGMRFVARESDRKFYVSAFRTAKIHAVSAECIVLTAPVANGTMVRKKSRLPTVCVARKRR